MSARNEEIVARLLERYERTWSLETRDPFKALVRTILSQNTNGRNQTVAYRRLEGSIGVTPELIFQAPTEVIAEAIRPAGMYNQRSRVLKRVSEEVITRFDGDLDPVIRKPYDEAREELMSLPGVGPKTADVVLMFVAGKSNVPVDRHIFRISKRLEIVPQKAVYDEVRVTLENASSPERREDVHVFLIRFGRETCTAQRPRCSVCFLEDLCPYQGKNLE